MHFVLFSRMNWITSLLIWVLATAQASPDQAGNPPLLVTIPAGIYRPLFRGRDDLPEVEVGRFLLEDAPVSNDEFLKFVRARPQWRRSAVRRLFADPGYLRHWIDDLNPGNEPDTLCQPVVNVSWFAAKAYAAWRGRRLPTTAEWEWAASAGFLGPKGTNEVEFKQSIAGWYGTPSPTVLPVVRSGRPNFYGVHDLHGLVWEWTADFNSSLVTGDARGDTGIERQLFCGAGSQGAQDRDNFPAFMRAGFRSSLKASYTLHNLGFRCAADFPSKAAPSP